jgi:hypothetical protein
MGGFMSNLRVLTKEELDEILKKHLKWLRDEEGGERANLSYADLSSANLRYADLSSANLRSANLRYANLRYANLSSADLSSANLRYADLSSANLRYADLRYANLRYANLSSADLIYFTFNRNTAYFVFDGMIRIGCEYHKIETWLDKYEEIGKEAGYSDIEIMGYKGFIDLCVKLQEKKPIAKPKESES